jgi:hypothetical protein
MIERMAPITVSTSPIQEQSDLREVMMTNVQFFRTVLIMLIAAAFISGTMMVALAMTVDPSGYQQVY